MMSLQSNDFELFQLAEQFDQADVVIVDNWKKLQRLVHPDRHVGNTATQQRIVTQWSARINEAYSRLRNPLHRGIYLCELRGCLVQSESNTSMSAAFLMQQIEWREELEVARKVEDFDRLEVRVSECRVLKFAEVEKFLDQTNDLVGACEALRILLFLDRFHRDVRALRQRFLT